MSCPTGHPVIRRARQASSAYREFWNWLARITDWSLSITQPLAASADVAAMLPALDAAVLVADWGRTTPAALAEATANEPELARPKRLASCSTARRTKRLKNYGVHFDLTANGRRRGVT